MKILSSCLIFVLFYAQLKACEICGCGVGNYYLGLMPQFNKNFVGLRYRSLRFESHLNSRILRTREYFHTTELWGRFYPVSKLQVLTFLPYSFNYQTDINNKQKNLQGFNDIMFLSSYNIFQSQRMYQDTIPRQWKHSIWLGGGLKVPTGRYNFNDNDANQVANPNFQLGSGSFDFVLTAFYNLRYKKFGFNQDIAYKINTKNAHNYRFGNRLSSNSNVFYVQQFKKNFALMPYTGIYYEFSAKDIRENRTIMETGGNLLAGNLGLDVYTFKKITTGFNMQIPLQQKLGNGEFRSENRWNVHFSVLF